MGLRLHEVLVQPGEDDFAHFGEFLVAAVEEFDVAVFFLAVFFVEGEEVVADAFDAFGRGEFVSPAVEAQVRAGDDQLVDLVGLKVLQ